MGKTYFSDENILIKNEICSAGSKMLENFSPPYGAEVIDRLNASKAENKGQSGINEFGFLGQEGKGFESLLKIKNGGADFALCVDTVGEIRIEAAKSGLYFLKPTYGTVSRFGIVSTAASMEAVGILSKDVNECFSVLSLVAGKDDKDGAMHPDACYSVKEADANGLKIKILNSKDYKNNINEKIKEALKAESFDFSLIEHINKVSLIILCAEASNNISRFDGIKFGHRTEKFSKLNDIYVNSRDEGFTFNTKLISMLGAYVLSESKIEKYFFEALKIRRMIKNEVFSIFENADALILPLETLDETKDKFIRAYNGLTYSALANLAGLPAIGLPCGVQVIAKPKCENILLALAKALEKEEF